MRRAAPTSVAGEGGVGKTSTCELLLADEEVRRHFAGDRNFHLKRLDLPDTSPSWPVAEQLYDVLLDAPAEEQSTYDYNKRRRNGLKLSCGSLLAIGTFHGLLRNRMLNDGNSQTLRGNFEKRVLSFAGEDAGKETLHEMQYYGLYAAIEENLTHLDSHRSSCVKLVSLRELRDEGKDVRLFRTGCESHFIKKKLSSRYAASEVMAESSTRLSFPILCRLWHVETVERAGEIALPLVDIDLGSTEGGSTRE